MTARLMSIEPMHSLYWQLQVAFSVHEHVRVVLAWNSAARTKLVARRAATNESDAPTKAKATDFVSHSASIFGLLILFLVSVTVICELADGVEVVRRVEELGGELK